MNILEQTERLADLRDTARLADDAYKERMQEPDIARLATARRNANDERDQAEHEVRNAIVKYAATTGELDPGFGVVTKRFLVPKYSDDDAIAWLLKYLDIQDNDALAWLREAMEKHRTALNALLKDRNAPFVTYKRELRSQIASDLRAKLNGYRMAQRMEAEKVG